MLSSCAPGVTVVNIDTGSGAGVMRPVSHVAPSLSRER
jgi:NCAIR mutase (PurE)-related protein